MIEMFDCDQGSVDWYRLRLGLPTASCFADIISPGKGSAPSVMRKTYMYKLAGEIVTGEPQEVFVTKAMERGQIMESEARDCYALVTGADPQRIGFIRNGNKGCSPDALIGNDGLLEIKSASPHILIPLLLKNEFPPEHKAQCQGALWVAEREWVDLGVYWPKLPLLKKRAVRDEDFIRNLAAEVERFNAELQETVERIRRWGDAAEGLAA